MSSLKIGRIGLYGNKDRLLQKTLSFEKTSLTHKNINVYKYLGDKTNGSNASISDMQDSIFMETTDRSYDSVPVEINAQVDNLDEAVMDLSKFGIISPIGDTQIFRVHVNSFDQDGLGRYLIVGDVIEVPFFEQNGIKAFFECTDIDKKSEFEQFHIVVTTVPVKDTQEMEDLPIPSNSDALGDLQTQLDAAFHEDFVDGGLDSEPYLYVDRDYVVDDYVDAISTITYNDPERTTYEPRANDDWLDDPNGKVF
jgi:hypothetical protein